MGDDRRGRRSRRTRRGLLAAFGVSLAGCAGRDGDGSGGGARTTETEPTTGAGTTRTTRTARSDPDLREANVVGVEVTPDGDRVRFDVTLHHDDDGEEGYADWWQVERLDGTRVGRRDLAHPHSRQPFTRSGTFAVDAGCVVVRGHDQTHGYGGQAAVVDVDAGAVRTVDQGPEPQSFSASDCP